MTTTTPNIEKLKEMDLAEAAQVFQSRARARETKKTYGKAIRSYLAFCHNHGYEPLPGGPGQVVEYVTFLAVARELKPATIRTHFAGIRAFYRDHLGRRNFTHDDAVIDCLNGIQRTLGIRQRQAAALQATDLRKIIKALPRKNGELTNRSCRNKAMVLLMYAAALRASEIEGIRRSDVTFDKRGLLLFLRSSKTDQMQKGIYIGVGRGQHESTCPVRALEEWFERTPGFDLVISSVHGSDTPTPGAMRRISVTRHIKTMVASIGLDPEKYSSHSPRSGITTDLNAAAEPSAVVQERTRHKSAAMVARYHRPKDALATNFSRKVGL